VPLCEPVPLLFFLLQPPHRRAERQWLWPKVGNNYAWISCAQAQVLGTTLPRNIDADLKSPSRPPCAPPTSGPWQGPNSRPSRPRSVVVKGLNTSLRLARPLSIVMETRARDRHGAMKIWTLRPRKRYLQSPSCANHSLLTALAEDMEMVELCHLLHGPVLWKLDVGKYHGGNWIELVAKHSHNLC
jgi:hypothetical protein